jgi:hypothetical protein
VVRASSVERALLFDIVVCEKGCAGGGLGLAVAGSTDLLLCVFLERGCLVLRISGAIWRFWIAGCLRDERVLSDGILILDVLAFRFSGWLGDLRST